ncbi:hypothetical protein WJX72_001483 [[Myrmecia] bisecta]|uniref:Uncharacterized protein n=1 Tax=[Myrmecia] bisecta TaxID=41462 RepID=A0AAW1PX69_9CHLO
MAEEWRAQYTGQGLQTLEEKARYWPLGRRKRHCGGGCISRFLAEAPLNVLDPDWQADAASTSAQDDDSSCRGRCGMHGFCQQGICSCVTAYMGQNCSLPKQLPLGMHAVFEGDILFNRQRLQQLPGNVLRYASSPKLGSLDRHEVNITITDALRKALPATDMLRGSMFNTCAIVGNSGILLKYEFGAEIDAHDMVMRFNVGPTKGFEEHVGSRTTLRLINTNHAGWHEGTETVLIQMQSQTGVNIYTKFRTINPHAPMFAFDPAFSEYVSSNIGVLPTGGYFGIWLALQRCHKVHMYGFYSKADFGIAYHYFDDEVPTEGKAALHDYAQEYARLMRLVQDGLLELREPCLAACAGSNGTAVSCPACPTGSTCQCASGRPLPAPRAGFCQAEGWPACFVKCPDALGSPCRQGKGLEPPGLCSAVVQQMRDDGHLTCS